MKICFLFIILAENSFAYQPRLAKKVYEKHLKQREIDHKKSRELASENNTKEEIEWESDKSEKNQNDVDVGTGENE